MINHLAFHAQGKIQPDNIFLVGAKAKAAKAKFGVENVTDASVGILLDDAGKMALLASVEEATRRLRDDEVAPYAPIGGVAEFREDVVSYLFGHIPNRQPVASIATAGATGAVFLAIWNLLSTNDMFITHDYYWSPYAAIARNSLRRLALFKTFLPDGRFNVAGALEETQRSLEIQGRALLIINTPCHNPTGLCLTLEEAKSLKNGLVEIAQRYPSAPITLLIDAAYWEFEDPAQNQAFMSLFQGLPENLLFTMAYSTSKSMTRYGLRNGAFLASGATEQQVRTVIDTFESSIRATWSNTTRMGQSLFSKLYRDPQLWAQLLKEQADFAALCNKRGETFMQEANQIGLPHTPYKKGFFVTLPTTKSQAVSDRLGELDKIFVVPLKKGIRVAFCALASGQVPGLAARIQERFEA
ncbi:MAG: aminotransferase class I/II-fold pyridoxal phosphate-dependent enzyme [Acidobacteria bacterium]|nr:aminotransferase class I/II-fold pyridoxal phosphate-dependent enzyme [Acidobacteriota bacterium]MCB9398358.1 aminotransferase class I/II-fold pyridoxal phosphate-dependent enzyme [Acidobacteriota bacterium]